MANMDKSGEEIQDYLSELEARYGIAQEDIARLLALYRSKDEAIEAVFSTIDCGVIRHTAQGQILKVNQAALDILGYGSREELQADFEGGVAGSVLPDDQKKLRARMRAMKSGDASVYQEYCVRHRDGRMVYVTGNIRLLAVEGQLVYQRVLLDHTVQRENAERKRREERYLQMEMISGLSSDYASVFFFNMDAEKIVRFRYGGADGDEKGRMMDRAVPFEAMKGRLLEDVCELDRPALSEALEARRLRGELEKRETFVIIYRRMEGDQLRYWQMKAVRTGDWGREHRAVIGLRSIDEEYRAQMLQQRQIEESQELLMNAVADIYLGLIQVDMTTWESEYIYIRDNEMTRMSSGPWDGYLESQMGFVLPEDREAVRGLYARTSLEGLLPRGKAIVNFRGARVLEGGGHRYYASVVYAQENNGHPTANLFIMDNTETMVREQEQRRLLEDALARAERASKAKSIFLSNMSHDIRTPMNAIIGFTSLAASRLEDKEKVSGYLDKIASSSSYLLSLINDVLDMSCIESGKIQIEEKPCSLGEMIRDLRSLVQTDVAARGLTFSVDTQEVRSDRVLCDKLRLNRVLLNLLSNAVKFSRPGGMASLRVVQTPSEREGFGDFAFHVADNGVGISDAFIEHLFEPFEREKNSTISGIQGTGLGMAITKNLVDLMGGTIEVTSALNEGTEFVVRLSLRLEEGEAPAGKAEERRRWHGERILLVEDNELNREIAEEILGEAGFAVESAGNGQIAVDMVRRSEAGYYSLVLMDVQMPVMDGYTATRAIRRLDDPALSRIPILAMTANAFEEDKTAALEAGMNAHIAKPVDVAKLMAVLAEILPG